MGAVKNEALCFCLSIFISLSFSFTSALLTPDGVNFEVQALMDMKKLLNDPSGVLNWDENAVDPCGWTLVTCSHDNLVTTLAMGRQNLSGTISKSIGNLTHLISLQLQENNISGIIPIELGNLPKLEELDLSNNSLTGDIPSSLAKLENLQYLRLNDNNLTGAVPMAFANLTHLNFIDLSFNNLSGPIPRIQAKRVNVLGNPMICSTSEEAGCSEATPLPLPISQNSTQNFKTLSRQSSHGVTLALALGSAIGCFSLLIIGLVLWKYNQKKRIFWDINEQQHEEVCLGNLRRFPFRELRIATNNFSSKNFLGKGGFGNVYKGHLQDGTVVAVKRLKDGNISGGEDQFQTEVEMISLAVHRNLLRLYGFCVTSTERLLVYPYMSNGSVAARLKAKPSLDWGTRKRIALGAARGLVYLHEQCDPKIIHRDVKAANILLDDYCEAVVGDFGLAKLLDRHDSHVTTAVRGTIGHIAPEYLSTGQSSEKTDVFGFGILLIELITGMRALEFGKASGNQKGGMLDWVRKIHEEKKIELLVDKDLKNSYDVLEVEETLKVALLCTQYMPSHRPKMSEVVRLLEGDGVAERWEDSQRNGGSRVTNSEASFTAESGVGYGDADESWLVGQDMELSGPR